MQGCKWHLSKATVSTLCRANSGRTIEGPWNLYRFYFVSVMHTLSPWAYILAFPTPSGSYNTEGVYKRGVTLELAMG